MLRVYLYIPLGVLLAMNENEDDTNVIPFNFNRRSTDIPHDIAHPASKWFDDPLENLLNEFSEDECEELESKKDFISHLEKPQELNLSLDQGASAMSESLLGKVNHIKESVLRLKYYMNEMNLDD